MPMYRKLTTAAAVAALAFGLAACGGGGSDEPTASAPPPTTTPDPMPPAPTPVAVTVPDAMYLDAANAPMAGSMTIAAGDSYTSGGVTFSCPAGGDDCEVEVMADGSVTSTGGEATAALSDAAMLQVAQAKQAEADAMAAAALENRDRVIGKDRAVEDPGTIVNVTRSGAAVDATSGIDAANIAIGRGPGAAARVRVTAPTGYAAHDDPALPNGAWAGTHLARNVPGTGMHHLFVYTDIEPPTRIQFYNWDGDATTPSRYADVVTDAADFTQPADSSTVITPLVLGGAGAVFSAAVADLTRFPAARSPEEGSFTQRYRNNEDTDPNTPGFERVSIPGNYNGAGGRYICTGGTAATPCQVTVAPNGAYTILAAHAWTFVPELNATAWRGDQEFMSFGWWLQEPTAQTGSYALSYYADGVPYNNQDAAAATINLAAGSAVYNGRAAGKYVVQTIDDTGVTGGEAGQFVAAASLTARFTGAGGAAGTIQGAISGFQSDNADVDVSGWSVTLNRQTLATAAFGGTAAGVSSTGAENDPTDSAFDGTTATMGEQTAYGTWTSRFYGQPTPAGSDAYPLAVGGTFQADNESASIAGAFGARR